MTTVPSSTDSQPDQADEPLIALDPVFPAGYSSGLAAGIEIGYRMAEDELADAWHAVADRVARGGPSFAELQARRYGREAR